MQLTVEDENGEDVTFSCADSLASRMTSRAILEGMTYPALPFVEPVRGRRWTSAPTAGPCRWCWPAGTPTP